MSEISKDDVVALMKAAGITWGQAASVYAHFREIPMAPSEGLIKEAEETMKTNCCCGGRAKHFNFHSEESCGVAPVEATGEAEEIK